MQRLPWCTLLALVASTPALADPVGLAGTPTRGRVRFVITGASMTDNQGLTNGVNCLEESATAQILADDLPLKPRLVSATLYLAGTLLDEDGGAFDYPGNPIFQLNAPEDTNISYVEDQARLAAPTEVQFRPPGATASVTVRAPQALTPYVTAFRKVGGIDPGNVAFYLVPIDVTDVIANEGDGVLAGTYELGGLLADVCQGEEAVCHTNPECAAFDSQASCRSAGCLWTPGPNTCTATTCQELSGLHFNGAASWALVLVVEDPSLPLTAISFFEGLEQLISGPPLQLILDDGLSISDPAAGALAVYALEGDLSLGLSNGARTCNADEYIEVDGDSDPGANGLCLVDADNPEGNLFNGTINVQARTDSPPACGGPAEQCCQGPGLCPVVGVDIDRFNISSALEPGATSVRVTVGSNGDQIAVAAIVVALGVFEPILAADTQVRVVTARDDQVVVGSELIYSIAISNTGNTDATGVAVSMDAPPGLEDFAILDVPPGSADESTPTGGVNGTGRVQVSGFSVRAGKIAEVRFRMQASCGSLDANIGGRASVVADTLEPFDVDAQVVTVTGPGVGPCEGVGPEDLLRDGRRLRGGACQSAGGGLMVLLGALAVVALRRGRRRS